MHPTRRAVRRRRATELAEEESATESSLVQLNAELQSLGEWKGPPALSEDHAPCASLDHRNGSGLAYAPQSAAWAARKQAVASGARRRPPQS